MPSRQGRCQERCRRRRRRGRRADAPRLRSTRCRGNDRQRPQRQARARALPGGGTSGLLANALAKAAKERGINLETAAEAYGNHVDMLPDFDWSSGLAGRQLPADLQKDCERVGNKCVACRGKQYIELSQNGDKSLAFVSEQLSKLVTLRASRPSKTGWPLRFRRLDHHVR